MNSQSLISFVQSVQTLFSFDLCVHAAVYEILDRSVECCLLKLEAFRIDLFRGYAFNTNTSIPTHLKTGRNVKEYMSITNNMIYWNDTY